MVATERFRQRWTESPTGAHDTGDAPPVEDVVDDSAADLLTGDD